MTKGERNAVPFAFLMRCCLESGVALQLGVCQHQLDAVLLIDSGCAGVIVDRHNVGVGVGVLDGACHALCHDVIRQAAERLRADDVLCAGFRQHCHFGGDHPALLIITVLGILLAIFGNWDKIHGNIEKREKEKNKAAPSVLGGTTAPADEVVSKKAAKKRAKAKK